LWYAHYAIYKSYWCGVTLEHTPWELSVPINNKIYALYSYTS